MVWALAVYRLSTPSMKARNRILPTGALQTSFLKKLVEILTGITIPENAIVGGRLRIEHSEGMVIYKRTAIVDGCLIRHGVTL